MSLEVKIYPARLNFRFPFRIAHGERTGTDAVFLKVVKNGTVGFGEATLPPYLGITSEDVESALNLSVVRDALLLETPQETFAFLADVLHANAPALAAIDMACWQIYSKQRRLSVAELQHWPQNSMAVPHSYTLGVSDLEEMKRKIDFGNAAGFSCFKLKLDGACDERVIEDFRRFSDLPFAVDANQAWKSLEHAFVMLHILEREHCIMIEQPFDKSDRKWSRTLSEATAIPIIADEACQYEEDLNEIMSSFDGVNVKLQKCGGITSAVRMLEALRAAGKLALLGCMSESSIGCNAAEQLTGMCNWADLDGPWLNINNDELLQRLGYEEF